MTKYAALGEFLHSQRVGLVKMSFAEIEKIIGGKLPASQRYPAWWSNNPMNNTMTRVWLDAGFQTEQVNVAARKLVFRRIDGISKASANSDHDPVKKLYNDEVMKSGIHPLIGWMKGTIMVPEGFDLTEPADSEWGDIAYGDDPLDPRE